MLNEITIDNIESCIDYLDPDISENLGREYFHGFYSTGPDGSCNGVLVWELKNADASSGHRGMIMFYRADDTEIGKDLIDGYSFQCRSLGVADSSFELGGLKPDELEMFRSAGFQILERESIDLKLTIRDLKGLKFLKNKIPPYIITLSELSTLEYKKGIANYVFSGNKKLLEDITMLPPQWFEGIMSSAIRNDSRVNGLFLIHNSPSGVLMPQVFFASGVNSKTDLLDMVNNTVRMAMIDYPPDTPVLIRRHDKSVAGLVSYLFPGFKGDTIFAGIRQEGGDK